jgi:3-hydroxyisobutyrate dehydrogenase
MAERVVAAGMPLRVFDVAPDAVAALVAKGAQGARSAADAAHGADVVACMVRTDEQVLDAATGAQGALAVMPPGSVFVVQSTVLPSTIHEIVEAARPREVGVVDAPVTGGVGGATDGTLVVMAGGDPADLERCQPLLDAMSKRTVHCGGVGTGMVAKLCNNLINYMSYLGSFEADRLARASGLDAERLDAILTDGGLMTKSMRGYLALIRQEVATLASMQENLEAITAIGEKDVAHAIAAGRDVGLEMPGAEVCRQQMARLYCLERGDE